MTMSAGKSFTTTMPVPWNFPTSRVGTADRRDQRGNVLIHWDRDQRPGDQPNCWLYRAKEFRWKSEQTPC